MLILSQFLSNLLQSFTDVAPAILDLLPGQEYLAGCVLLPIRSSSFVPSTQ
jgi:hypothetical protein